MEALYEMMAEQSEIWGPRVLQIGTALLILIGGWLVAIIVGALVRGALRRTTLDNKLAKMVLGEEKGEAFPVEAWFGKAAYYVILLLAVVGFFDALELTVVSQPLTSLLDKVFGYVPQVLGAAVLLAIAWVVAIVLRRVVRGGLDLARLDERVGGDAGLEEEKRPALSRTLSDAVYWLVFLLFLPNILGALQLEGLLAPVQSLIDRLLTFLPNILAAGLILAVGWFIARIVQRLVTNLLAAVGADQLGERIGLGTALGTRKLSGLLGLVVYIFILFNVLVSSLNALALHAITEPASLMIGQILAALPLLFAAGLLLTLAFFIGRLVSGLLANVLAGAGFDNVLQKLGLARGEVKEGERTPSAMVGILLLSVIMLFASIEAAGLLGFTNLAVLIASLLEFAGQLVLGLVVFALGLFLANLAAETIRTSASAQAPLLATAARIAVIVLAAAIGLRQMGIANEIIELAFGMILGAIAVAVAIAFGLGGREIAAKQIEQWRGSLNS